MSSALLAVALLVVVTASRNSHDGTPAVTLPTVDGKPSAATQQLPELFATHPEAAVHLLRHRLPEKSAAVAPNVKTVCGLTVVTADPGGDPRIVIPTPEDRGQYKIRRIEPPACNE